MIDLLEDLFGFFGPEERFWIFIVDPNELFDCRDELWHTSKDAPANSLPGDLAKPSFYQVEPRGTGRSKVQMESGMFFKPLFHVGMVVRPVVVQNQVEG